MREADHLRNGARPVHRRHGRWPGGLSCVWFYDPKHVSPSWSCPLIIQRGDGSVRCLEFHQVDTDQICKQ